MPPLTEGLNPATWMLQVRLMAVDNSMSVYFLCYQLVGFFVTHGSVIVFELWLLFLSCTAGIALCLKPVSTWQLLRICAFWAV